MVTIDELHSEVVIEGGHHAHLDDADKPAEVRVEELRGIVRELIMEELDHFFRTEVPG